MISASAIASPRSIVPIRRWKNSSMSRMILTLICLVISPGPGTPTNAGVTIAAIEYFKDKLPIFGVCLGHQAIVQHFGGIVGHAPEVVHGKPSRITHNEKGIFEGIENPLQAGRYHSLCAVRLPECLIQTAEFEGT